MKKIVFLLLSFLTLFAANAKQKADIPPQKIGILWSSWSVSNFANHEDYIAIMEDWGIEYVSLNPTYFMDTYAKGILTEWNGETVTPTIANQKEIIKALIAHGFYINYRPHVDPIIYAMPEGNDRSTWSTDPGGLDWRGKFDKLDPTDPKLGYKEKIILPGLKMLAEAIRESNQAGIKLVTPIRFDLGAELMNSMLNYPQHWIDLCQEVRNLLNTTYKDVKDQIVIGHNFCHHIEYLLRLDGHLDYFTRIMADGVPDYSLLYLDRPGVTQETRNLIGRYIAGLDEMSLSQYMPLDIFTPAGQTTTPEQVEQALYWHEDNFIKESLIRECNLKPEELPVLHIGEYGMGWRGLNAPNVWDIPAWEKAGRASMILSEAQQKADAAIAIDGIIRYVEDPSDTQYRSFLLWFGGKPYDVLNINSYSNWYNPPAAESLREYWSRHKGVPNLDRPNIDFNYKPSTITVNAGQYQTATDDDNDGLVSFTLDGSASKDAEGTIVSYKWTLEGVLIAEGTTATVQLPVGINTIVLTVTNDKGETATAKVVLTAVAGAKQYELFDNFEQYQNNAELASAWGRNENGAQCDASLISENALEATQSMQLHYNLSGNSYAGRMKGCSQDVSAYEGLRYQVRGDGSGADLLVQLRDAEDHYWKSTIQLTSTETQEVFLPFDEFVGGYNTSGSWTNRGTVTEIAFYVENGTEGTIVIDNIRASAKDLHNYPLANAGEDILVSLSGEQTSATVLLDGSFSQGSNLTYLWTENGNTLATTQSAEVSFSLGKHLVYLTVTDADGYKHTDFLFVEVENSDIKTDIENPDSNLSILKVYPNPADSKIWLRVPQATERIDIFDISGKCVISQPVSNEISNSSYQTSTISTSALPNGIYLVRTAGKTVEQTKLIVRH